MELIFPWILIIGIIFIIVLLTLKIKKKPSKDINKRIANIEYIQSTPYYKELMKKYKILKALTYAACVIGLLCALILISRPVKIEREEISEYKRDIFLCMDVSSSMNKINAQIVDSMQETVQQLKGDRIGIVIFNSSPVTLVPLTDDYNYVIETLNRLKEGFTWSNDFSVKKKDSTSISENYFNTKGYLSRGTSARSGASIMPDALASTAYSFPDIEEERTRFIVFSTDNKIGGESIVTMQEAADICNELKIKVYAITPDSVGDEGKFKVAIKSTGGEIYKIKDLSTVSNVVNNIEKEEKSVIDGYEAVYYKDKPEIPFILLTLSLIAFLILDKKVEL